jgi:hypothetical protein
MIGVGKICPIRGSAASRCLDQVDDMVDFRGEIDSCLLEARKRVQRRQILVAYSIDVRNR